MNRVKRKSHFKPDRDCHCLAELFCLQLIDLLAPPEAKKNPHPLEIKKDSAGMVTIQGITMKHVTTSEALKKMFEFGLSARHVSGTAMNAESSRSHLIFAVVVKL